MSVLVNVCEADAIRYVRSQLLRQAGFAVIDASTTGQIFDLVEEHDIAVILLDVSSTESDIARRRFKAHPKTSLVEWILIGRSVRIEEGQSDYCFAEPVNDEVLVAAVASAVRHWDTVKQLKEAEGRLADRERELRSSNEDLRRFSYAVSSELHHTLSTVQRYADVLAQRLEAGDDPLAAQAASIVASNASRIDTLITGLLRYVQIEDSGCAKVQTDMNVVVQRAMSELEPVIRSSNALVTADELPTITADDSRMLELLKNLISNALRFRRAGEPPRVHIFTRLEDNAVVFAVKDNGVGVGSAYIDRVFNPRQRLHAESAIPGSGVELAACKRIVEVHRGRIWTETTRGAGSTFYFTIPSVLQDHVS